MRLVGCRRGKKPCWAACIVFSKSGTFFFFLLDLRYRVLISLSVFVGNDELRLSSGIESGASWIPRGIFGGESLRVFFSMWDGT